MIARPSLKSRVGNMVQGSRVLCVEQEPFPLTYQFAYNPYSDFVAFLTR